MVLGIRSYILMRFLGEWGVYLGVKSIDLRYSGFNLS